MTDPEPDYEAQWEAIEEARDAGRAERAEWAGEEPVPD